MAKSKVFHKQLYRQGPWGGEVNTTICGRVRNGQGDYNTADTDDEVTCKYCLNIMAPRRLKKGKE